MMKMASLFQSVRLGRGALVLTLALGVVPAASVALAQELLPELAAPAAQHKAADEALDKQKLEAIALAAKSYLSALDSVEKTATAKGEIDLVAAVVKEREAVASGALEPDLPAALPKAKLQMSRKTLLAAIKRINADFAKRRITADADYLRVLASLQTKAASNPELAKQLAAEKAALLSKGGAASENGATAANKARGKNVVVNGDFEKSVDGKPEGWKKIECVKVENEANNTFIRFARQVLEKDGKASFFEIIQQIDIPKGASSVSITAKCRIKDSVIQFDENNRPVIPGVVVGFRNQEGKAFLFIQAKANGKNGPWKTVHAEGAVPNGVTAYVSIENGRSPGQIDFDDIEVTFK